MQADSKFEDPSMMKRLQQRYKLKNAMSTGSRRLGRIYNLFTSSTNDGSRKQFRVKKVWLISCKKMSILEVEFMCNYYFYFEWK